MTWTGDLGVGASATITYSVTVRNPDPGNRSLVSSVTSTTPFNNCPTGGSDPRCANTVTVLIPALSLGVGTDVASTTQGGVVRYTVTATNTGQTPYAGAVAAVSLAGLIDDAVYNSDATASTGNLTAGGGSLTWTFNLAVGASATVTFSATVNDPTTGNRSLVTSVASAAAGSSCPTSPVESRLHLDRAGAALLAGDHQGGQRHHGRAGRHHRLHDHRAQRRSDHPDERDRQRLPGLGADRRRLQHQRGRDHRHGVVLGTQPQLDRDPGPRRLGIDHLLGHGQRSQSRRPDLDQHGHLLDPGQQLPGRRQRQSLPGQSSPCWSRRSP